jgi:hypothetical protein
MIGTIAVAAFFAILLVLEWRYRRAIIRLVTAALALLLLLLTQPNFHRAARRALDAPLEARVPQFGDTSVTSYESGVFTMERAIAADNDMFENEKLLALGVLMWLACSPALRRERPLARGRTTRET